MINKRYTYFINYFCGVQGGFGYGNTVLSFEGSIESIEDIRLVQSLIMEQNNVEKLTITNFKLLKEEEVEVETEVETDVISKIYNIASNAIAHSNSKTDYIKSLCEICETINRDFNKQNPIEK